MSSITAKNALGNKSKQDHKKTDHRRSNKLPPLHAADFALQSQKKDTDGNANVLDTKTATAAKRWSPCHSRQPSARLDELIQKYIGCSPSLASSSLTPLQCDTNLSALSDAMGSIKKKSKPVTVKRIMAVKTEQDAAISMLKHAPRTFHATAIPDAVLATKDAEASAAINVAPIHEPTSREEVVGSGSVGTEGFRARLLPPTTCDPLYVIHVADAQLKRYGDARPSSARPC